MSEASKIEWTDATFNPWWGCEKVSPGCAHCYAERDSARFHPGEVLWGDGHSFRFFGEKHWNEPLRWARNLPAKLGRRPRVFCASMADVFEVRRDISEERYRLFALIAATPELDWLILTKRPEHARDLLTSPWWWAKVEGTAQRIHEERTGQDVSMALAVHGPLPNVWLGVSIENARHTYRADVLREIPAAVRFISAEPLLGSLYNTHGPGRRPLDLEGIDWVIVGGESGPDARPMHPDWAREIRDACFAQCEPCATGSVETDGVAKPFGYPWHLPPSGYPETDCTRSTAFFFKQWGEYAPGGSARLVEVAKSPGGSGINIMHRAGKKNAGRALDGRTWDEMPMSGVAS